MIHVINAIKKIDDNARCEVINNDINNIIWYSTPIPKGKIETKMNEMANEPEQSKYAEQRR